MSDIVHKKLYRLTESQAGYFTAEQAVTAGMDHSTLSYHSCPGGRYLRIRRGLYRLRDFPSTPHEHIMAAWLPLRDAGAVVSHETALELHDLSDAIADAVHLSLSRAERGQRRRPGVRLHTLSDPPGKADVRNLVGLPVTSPERTIVDVLETGAQPEQVEMAIDQALARGLTTQRRLTAAASNRSDRVRKLIQRATGGAAA
jgi:predicted transcriptional regulator of viral defense system